MDTVAHLGPDLLGDDWEPGIAERTWCPTRIGRWPKHSWISG